MTSSPHNTRFIQAFVDHMAKRENQLLNDLISNRMTGMDGLSRSLDVEYQRGSIAMLRELAQEVSTIARKTNEG